MSEEIKIRIKNYEEIEDDLRKLGAVFEREIQVEDTYFDQPEDSVLKISKIHESKECFIVHLSANNGKFSIVSKEKIDERDYEQRIMQFDEKCGIKCILKKRIRFFKFPDSRINNININIIEDVGEFLIVEGEGITADFITGNLKMKTPEYVTVSFDKLKARL